MTAKCGYVKLAPGGVLQLAHRTKMGTVVLPKVTCLTKTLILCSSDSAFIGMSPHRRWTRTWKRAFRRLLGRSSRLRAPPLHPTDGPTGPISPSSMRSRLPPWGRDTSRRQMSRGTLKICPLLPASSARLSNRLDHIRVKILDIWNARVR